MPEVTMEEMESQLAEVKPPVRGVDIKLEADDLPDFARGKTAAELADEVSRTRQALRLSEDARLSLSRTAEAPREVVQPRPTLATKTREELQELMREDPMAVMDYMATHLTTNLSNHLDQRFQPVVASSIASAENAAKAKYKDEFELFGDQIESVKKKVNADILTTNQGWEDIMAFVRGQSGNFDKLVERRASVKPRREEAREAQINDAGFTPREVVRNPAANDADTHGLDATQLEICRVMNIDPKDYKRYS